MTVIPVVSVPYQVQVLGGISVLDAPGLNAPRTGLVLGQGDVFHVSESIVDGDGRQYLRLADGRGWVLAEMLPREQDLNVFQAPLPVGRILPGTGSQPTSQESASQSENNRKSKAISKDSEAKPHVPFWVRLRRAKQRGVPIGMKRTTAAQQQPK